MKVCLFYGALTVLGICTNISASAYDQEDPATAYNAQGFRYLTVFTGRDNDWDDEQCIYARNNPNKRLDSTHNQTPNHPDIATANNRVIVAWTVSDGSDEGIKGRLFDPNFVPLTGELLINSTTAGKQCDPAVAMDNAGRWITVWTSGISPNRSVCGRLFNGSGSPVTSEFVIASGGDNFAPSVAMDPNGLIAASWSCRLASSSTYQAMYRQFNPDGSPRTTASVAAGSLANVPATCIDMNGSQKMVITWDGHAADPAQCDIFALVCDPNLPASSPFAVNTFTTGRQQAPSVSLADSGWYVVVWQSENADGSDDGICGRVYDANGLAQAEEFDINLYTYRKQHKPDVACSKYYSSFHTVWQREEEFCRYDYNDLECEYFPVITGQSGAKPSPNTFVSCGDASGNSFTDMTDLVALADRWLAWGSVAGVCNPDHYPDGHIDLADFYFTAANWMQCCQSPYPPEYIEYYYLNLLQRCQSRVKTIAVTIEFYSFDNYGHFPPTLQTLINEGYFDGEPFPGEMLMCPAVCPHVQASDYVYRGNDLSESVPYPGKLILIHDRLGNHANGMRNVAFVDYHVKQMTEAEFQAAVTLDNTHRRSAGYPTKPAE